MLLSFVIPAYNAERYIARCIASIYDQGIDNSLFEVIVIDDGSCDSTVSVCGSFKYDNLKIISIPNYGVSNARNLGIEKSIGKYVLFADSDDYFHVGFVPQLLESIAESPDLIILKSINDNSGVERYSWGGKVDVNKKYSGIELFESYFKCSVWGAAFNREFVSKNNIRFPVGVKNGEDTIFMLETFIHAGTIKFCDALSYIVVSRENSASKPSTSAALSMKFTLDYVNKMRSLYSENINTQNMVESLMLLMVSEATYFSIMCSNLSYPYFISYTRIKSFLPVKVQSQKIQRGVMTLNISYGCYYLLRYIKYRLFSQRHLCRERDDVDHK